ncbi:MAG: Gfo/Idh/MocA family oxidoreductase [Nitriliruptoraceae bacterium]
MTVGIAIVGHGFMARTHADAYVALGERVEVRYVVGRSRERASELAESIGATATDRLEQALEDDSVDAVDVCVPTDAHRDIAVHALAADRHVLLEKPIALDLAAADEIIAASERSAAFLMVGLVLRFWPEYVALDRLVADGEIGRPRIFSASRLSPPADWNSWMADVSRSGGVIVDLLPHDIDQALAVLGPAVSVSARGTGDEDHVVLTLAHEGGGVSVLEGSMAMPRAFPFSSTARVDGADGSAEYRFRVGEAQEGGNLGEAAEPAGLQVFGQDAVRSIEVEPADPFGAEVEAFVSHVERGVAPQRATGAQARDALAVSLAARRSRANGGVPEDLV